MESNDALATVVDVEIQTNAENVEEDNEIIEKNPENVEENNENIEKKEINILDILKNPIVQPIIKYGLQSFLKHLAKQQTSQVLASKGSKFITDNLINITKKQGSKGLRRRVRRREYKEIMKNREKLINEDFKNLLADQISSKLK